MSLLESGTWQGRIYSNGWVATSGAGSRIGGANTNIEAFTESQWVTLRTQSQCDALRTDVAPYPF